MILHSVSHVTYDLEVCGGWAVRLVSEKSTHGQQIVLLTLVLRQVRRRLRYKKGCDEIVTRRSSMLEFAVPLDCSAPA